MRLSIANSIFILGLTWALCLPYTLFAQDTIATSNKKPVDVNFIFNYYEQDGEHSAVTAGTGTEKLNDIANVITVNVPIDSTDRIGFTNGVNYYTSASTDKIDFKVSSASNSDLHWQMHVDYEKEKPGKNRLLSFKAGASSESDYISSSIGAGWAKWTKDKNNYFNLDLEAFFDTWVLIFPEELRQSAHKYVDTDKRKTFILSTSYSRVLNKRMQGSVFIEPVFQTGLLSTPFHRVYFGTTGEGRIERFPSTRFKLAAGFRLNTFIGSFLVLRLYNRFYWDDFGVVSNAISVEPVFKLGSNLSVYPIYRYYQQTAAHFFAPYAEHLITDTYYTSDYDLSAFSSHKLGVGLQYSPVWLNKKKGLKRRAFKGLSLRYTRYYRSDGLHYWMLNMGFSFSF